MATKRPNPRAVKRASASAPEAATPRKQRQSSALSHYQSKRDFTRTPEPAGQSPEAGPQYRYVIQKHWASHLHYDLRLELDGAMKSWAVPKGPSLDPRDKRLAVQVEDHPVEYNDFEGQIPAGQYGGGRVIIWDRGTWSPLPGQAPDAGLKAGSFKFRLHGLKLHGNWALVRLKGAQAKSNWLLIKEKDDAARPAGEFDVTEALPDSVGAELSHEAPTSHPPSSLGGRPPRRRGKSQPPPELIAPQLATLADAPPATPGDWLWELKFDGYRLLPRIAGGRVQLFTRNGLDWTARMPALAQALSALPVENAWLDGEIIRPDANGIPDFAALQMAFEGRRADALVLYLFDLLYLNGADWRGEPLERRRARLAELLADTSGPTLRLSQSFDADPRSLLDSAARMGMEGIIGKRREAPYRSGRSNDWIKLKTRQSDELLIAGFTEGQGTRAARGDIGALVMAAHDAHGTLRHAGNVGSGFDGKALAALKNRLAPLRIPRNPLANGEHVAGAIHWVRPELVAQIAHAGTTPQGRLRQPVYLGLREDKSPAEITLPGIATSGATMKAKTKEKTVSKPARAAPAVAGQNITHPERVVDASTGITKLDVARYYATVAPLILPHLARRPVALLRAPEGIGEEIFFQKHMESFQLPGVRVLDTSLDPGHAGLLEIDSTAGLLGAVQMNSLELHTWNATRDRIERPDRFTLDLDPGQGVAWPQVQEAAQLVHTLLTELGLVPFLKTSGGKGLHIVVPIKRLYDWDTVKAFSKLLTEHMARLIPDRFVALSGPKNRIGKIYVDYLRNGRGATTVSAWSARARPGMGVSVPVGWDELEKITGGAHWHLGNIESRLRVGEAPWQGYAGVARPIGSAQRQLNAAK